VRVPAKINPFLSVRGRRADGYHDVVTVLQTVSLHDELEVLAPVTDAAAHPSTRRDVLLALEVLDGAAAPDPDLGPVGTVPVGPMGGLAGEDNLAVRAARALLDELAIPGGAFASDLGGRPDAVTRLRLTKRIPIAAGMAGGSADAAAALVALDRVWGAELGRDRLQALAARLGADVPFCVVGGTALATGTGTVTTQVLAGGRFHWVVGIDEAPLSTAEVYAARDELGPSDDVGPDRVLRALRAGDVDLLGDALHNDLEVAALQLRPALVEGREALLAAGAVAAIVSGSGPTLLGLARDADDAHAIAARLTSGFARVEVVHSPAGGPELLASS
jgi:4-diphosphocytidyl-2-C-methyl-D-erythritol kinase